MRRIVSFYGVFLNLMGACFALPLITALIYQEPGSIRAFSLVMIQYRKGADDMSFEDLEIGAHYSPRERQMRIYRYLLENSKHNLCFLAA